MIWGYAGPWFGEFTGGDDSLMAKLRWLVEDDLKATHVFLPHVAQMPDAERDEVVGEQAYASADLGTGCDSVVGPRPAFAARDGVGDPWGEPDGTGSCPQSCGDAKQVSEALFIPVHRRPPLLA